MKRALVLFLMVPLLSMTVQNDKAKFIGTWSGEDNNEIGYMNFDPEGYAFFEIQGQIFGGKEFVIDGETGKMTYEVNAETNPIYVDLVVTKFETGEQKKLLCIAEFIDGNTMKFAINFQGVRPTEFITNNSIMFKREQ